MIKISAVVGTPDLQTVALGPYTGDLPAAFAKLAALGYDGVELMTKNPGKVDGPGIRRLLDEHNLELSQICTGHVWGEDKIGLVNTDATLSPEGMTRLKDFVDFAAAFFPPGVPVNIGRSRGRGDLSQPEKTMDAYERAFRELADYALPKKVRLTLEPITATLIKFILTTQDGIEMCRRVGRPNFGLMLDVCHMNIEDVDIYDSFRDARDLTRLVHVCDNNRKWPGSAHLDFQRIVATLDEIGYEGFVSTEMLPWPDPDSSARLAIESLRRFIPARAPR
ncbi:MAG TPA: sugar phosphate isomerase/epimerase family protein [Thermodesulfobacteriota bacterium]|nr:sugar phosphate isomerase/epimerase family protein [Thermodesulfobacteriota bacterium]